MTSSERNGPRGGDIIVHARRASAVTYVVGRFESPPELAYQKREDAIRCATAFAAAVEICAWYTDDGQTYQRITGRAR